MAGQRRTGTGAGRRPTAGLVRAAAALAGAALVAAALVAAGCGNGDGGDGDGGDGGGDGAVGAFCEAYAGYQQDFSGGASYDEVLTALRDIHPPPAVSDDFEALTRAVETMATVDTADPAAVARFQETTSAEAQEANANIIEYVADECAS